MYRLSMVLVSEKYSSLQTCSGIRVDTELSLNPLDWWVKDRFLCFNHKISLDKNQQESLLLGWDKQLDVSLLLRNLSPLAAALRSHITRSPPFLSHLEPRALCILGQDFTPLSCMPCSLSVFWFTDSLFSFTPWRLCMYLRPRLA